MRTVLENLRLWVEAEIERWERIAAESATSGNASTSTMAEGCKRP